MVHVHAQPRINWVFLIRKNDEGSSAFEAAKYQVFAPFEWELWLALVLCAVVGAVAMSTMRAIEGRGHVGQAGGGKNTGCIAHVQDVPAFLYHNAGKRACETYAKRTSLTQPL